MFGGGLVVLAGMFGADTVLVTNSGGSPVRARASLVRVWFSSRALAGRFHRLMKRAEFVLGGDAVLAQPMHPGDGE